MDNEETYSQRQEEELEVLESIFGEDFRDIRKDDTWKVPRPPEILLLLKPQESMSGRKEVHALVSLRAKFSENYPDSVPQISLEGAKGLSDEVLKNLTNDLKKRASELLGEVMILELCQIIQEVLHKYNRPTLSIYEENMKFKNEQKAKQKRKQEEMQRRKQDYQRREFEEEINRRKEEEKNLRKERKREKSTDDSKEKREHLDSTGSTGFDVSQCPPVPVSEVEFSTKTQRQVYRGKCIGKGPSGCVVHIGIDKETGCPLALHEWVITCPARKKFRTDAEQAKVTKYLKAVKAVEQELYSLLKLEHVNLVKYLAIRYSEEENHIQVDVLQEYVSGTNLQVKIAGNESVPLNIVRNITEQLLMALNYLHTHSVVHKNLKASSVFLDTQGLVRLSDYSIGKRLADLYKESHMEQPSVTFSDDAIPARNSKKGDILKLGMLVFSLVQGRHVKEYPPDIPTRLPTSFQDFLHKCLAIEDRLRWTASELLEHVFIKASISNGIDSTECRNGHHDLAPHDSDSDSTSSMDRHEPATYPIPTALQLSRLHSEFEEMQWLGKGGFGDVVKVRNKLDGRFYAIKRILLDPRKSQFNKKITREVKLLSRLNHENVVRYYNSWIETLQDQEENSSESASSINTESKPPDLVSLNSIGLIDNIDLLAPPPITTSVSDWASLDNLSFHADVVDDDDDDEDEDEDDVFGNLARYVENDESSEESIMFENSGEDGDEGVKKANSVNIPTSTGPTTEITTTDESSMSQVPKCYLYIQMEYCEKSTLREAINDGLCHDKARMWRLFRETLDGLVHVHEQGMIHRDLKPQNIFLDRNNHIKIGDFGLATSHTLGTATTASTLDLASSKSEGGDSALTGHIGTTLYVAPELSKTGSRTVYNQKVDMYSLGIIFFEMCYPGLHTKMERVKVLGYLRTEDIKMPEDWDDVAMQNEGAIIRWCLKHKPEKRPTAAELLKSPLVPAPALEKSHVVKSVRQALMDPHSAPHRLLMQELFSRPENRKDDVFYDIDVHKGQFSAAQQLMQERVHSQVIAILKRHGAVRVATPLLAPRKDITRKEEQEAEEENEEEARAEPGGPQAATFMDMSGTIVTLPHDLRVPFARYVGRNGIYNLKRYAIEKVFRKVKIHRSHPKELWECAFDIVTPTVCNLIPDAECISVVSEVINAFPVLSVRSYKITVNHTVLLNAVFAHANIPVNKYDTVKQVLADAKMEKLSKSQLQIRLLDLTLTSQQVSTLCSLIEQQGPLAKIQSLLKNLTRNKQSPISSQARQALHELEALRKNVEAFGVRLPIIVHLGFVHNLHQYSGIIFQVSAEVRKQKKIMIEVLAAGGRYDELVQRLTHSQLRQIRSIASMADNESTAATVKKQCAFGVSIAVERIVALNLMVYQSESKSASSGITVTEPPTSSVLHSHLDAGQHPLSTVDVLVAVIGRNQLFQERIKILKNLWEAGIHAEMTLEGSGNDADSLEILQDRAIKRGVSHLVILKDKDNSLRVRSYDHTQGFTKQQEKNLSADELVDYLSRKMKGTEDSSVSVSSNSSGSSGPSDSAQIIPVTSIHHGTRQLNIEILSPDKLAHNHKKRYESQVLSRVSQLPILQHISGKTEIYVLAVDIPFSALKTIVLGLETGHGEEEFNNSVANVITQLPKYRKYLRRITDMISDAKYHKEVPLIILYSYKDDNYRLLS